MERYIRDRSSRDLYPEHTILKIREGDGFLQVTVMAPDHHNIAFAELSAKDSINAWAFALTRLA